MKTVRQSAVAALLVAAVCGNALAHGWNAPRPQPYRGHDNRHASWIAPLLVLGIAGAAISAASQSRPHSPPPVTYSPPPVSYTPPPVTYTPPAVTYVAPAVSYVAPAAPAAPVYAYYCQSAGQYYPQVGYCNEGWQLIAPAR